MLTIFTKMTEHAFPHDHLQTGYSRKQNFTTDDLNLYLFHMQIEIPKSVKITTIRKNKVIIVLADPSSLMSQARGERVKMYCSCVVQIWQASVLYRSKFCLVPLVQYRLSSHDSSTKTWPT